MASSVAAAVSDSWVKLLILQIAFGPPALTSVAAKSSAEWRLSLQPLLLRVHSTVGWQSCAQASCLLRATNPDNHVQTLTINVAQTRMTSSLNVICAGYYIYTKIHIKVCCYERNWNGFRSVEHLPQKYRFHYFSVLHTLPLARIIILNSE